MNVYDYKEWLASCMTAGVTSLTLAAPGVGKTAVIRELAQEANRPLVVLEGAYLMDETALQGLPFAIDGKTHWLPPATFELPDNAILFIDEITSSPAQALLYQVLLERRIDRNVFPGGVSVIAAGNREEDAGSRWYMSPVVGNRVSLNMEYAGPSASEWVSWGVRHHLHPAILTGIKFYPEWLHRYDADRLRNPTPRSWHTASKLASTPMPLLTALTTTVGNEAAEAMEIVIANAATMVNPDAILSGVAKVPENPMASFMALGNMNRYMTTGSLSVAQATHAINFSHACLQKHGEAQAAVAIPALSQVKNIHNVPAYKNMVKAYARYL